jgi:DNA-directed RNA polymerase subunit N (RpoN/RPB10)
MIPVCKIPITCLSGCSHLLADEIEEIKKKMEEVKKPGGR